MAGTLYRGCRPTQNSWKVVFVLGKKKNKRPFLHCDCNKCGKSFVPRLKEEPHGDGVRQYLICPHCDQIYPVCKITPKGLAIREQIQDAVNRNDRKRIDELQRLLKPEVIRLWTNWLMSAGKWYQSESTWWYVCRCRWWWYMFPSFIANRSGTNPKIKNVKKKTTNEWNIITMDVNHQRWCDITMKTPDPFYLTTTWKKIRVVVLARDNHICQVCLRDRGRLVPADLVHHVLPIDTHPWLALVLSNLLSVCLPCHNRIHGTMSSRDVVVPRRARVFKG